MSRRSRAREVVLQVLYQDDLNPTGSQVVVREFVNSRLHRDIVLIEFAESLISGVRRNRTELDGIISRLASNWSLGRMAATDRNVMRLGAYEILYTETPGAVVINEAVDLARRYGSRQSSQFVNGVLDRLLQERS